MKTPRLLAALALLGAGTSSAQTLVTDFPVTNGSVSAMLYVPETNEIVIGGSFTRIGPFTGSFPGIDRTTGEWNTPNFPKPNGPVYAAAPDGQGGWYLGGKFTSIGGQPRASLARILPNGTVDPDWAPVVQSIDLSVAATVTAMVIRGDLLYIGGDFVSVRGLPRERLAAVDLVTGVLSSFNPGVIGSDFDFPIINTLAADIVNLYIGGNMIDTVGGAPRKNLAAVNLGTGLVSAWNPSPDGSVSDLLIDGGEILVAGDFDNIGGAARTNLAAVNLSTGLASAFFTPNPSGHVRAIAVSGASVYLGGFFANAGGQARANLAAVNRTTGIALAWNPSTNDTVLDLRLSGNSVYICGSFSTLNGVTTPRLGQLHATTGARIDWAPEPDGIPSLVIATLDSIFVGGNIQTIVGIARRNLASLDATTGALGSFDSDVDNAVIALERAGNTVFVGGGFANAGGQARQNLAAFGIDGTLLPAVASPSAPVFALASDTVSNTLFIGGSFTEINGTPRARLGEIQITTGALTAWNPGSDGLVNTILLDGSVAFIGGDFDNIGGQARQNLAAISRSTGLATAWQANANQNVNDLALNGGTLYVAGEFNTLDGQARGRLGALDTTTSDLLPWGPNISGGFANTILLGESTAFVGGRWNQLDGAASPALREIGLVSGVEPAFVARFANDIYTLASSPTRLFAGGNMRDLGDGRANLAVFVFDQPTGPTLQAKGRKKLTTSKAKVTLKGTATDATLVQFKIGNGSFEKAKGNPANWRAPVKLKPGKTIVAVRATGPGGTSKILKFTITRR